MTTPNGARLTPVSPLVLAGGAPDPFEDALNRLTEAVDGLAATIDAQLAAAEARAAAVQRRRARLVAVATLGLRRPGGRR
jgi:hypothetical protein